MLHVHVTSNRISRLDRDSLDVKAAPSLLNSVSQLLEAISPLDRAVRLLGDSKERIQADAAGQRLERLPLELFERIMISTLPPHIPEISGVGYRPKPLELTHVCRKWRDTLINFPTFWNRMTINRRTSSELIELYLGRSKESPLFLQFDWTSALLDAAHIVDQLEIVLEHSSRWFYLHIRSSSISMLAAIVFCFDPYTVPMLRTLELERVSEPSSLLESTLLTLPAGPDL